MVHLSRLSFIEFMSVVCESEAIVNSRPLTYVYNETEEGEALTPSDLIHGFKLTDLPPLGGAGLGKQYSLDIQRMKNVEKAREHFWQRWHKEYLNELSERFYQPRGKKAEVRQPAPGDVVLLKGERTPRREWRMGVVEETPLGRDGKVRRLHIWVPNIKYPVKRVGGGGEEVTGSYSWRSVNNKARENKGSIWRRAPCSVVPLEEQVAEVTELPHHVSHQENNLHNHPKVTNDAIKPVISVK
jgi:hypothetical protein